MIKKQLQLKNYIEKGLLPLFCFIVGTVWIGCIDTGAFAIEACVARYFISFCAGYLIAFLVSNKRDKVLRFMIQIVILLFLFVTAFFISLILVKCGVLHHFSKRTIVFVFGINVILFYLVLYIKDHISEAILLPIVLFTIGTMFAIVQPVGTGITWDDQLHYQNILNISHCYKDEYTKADVKLIYSAYTDQGITTVESLMQGKTGEFERNVNKLYKKGKKAEIAPANVRIVASISYLPEAIVLFLARGMGLPYTYVFIAGRWAEVLLYSLLLYLSLRRLKSGKLILFLISMFPLSIALMSNYSYDTWCIGLSMLAFAEYIGILQDESKKMKLEDILKICSLFVLAYVAKPNYFCMILAVLLIDESKLDKKLPKKKYYIIVLSTCLLLAAYMILPFIFAGTGGNDMRGGEDVNSLAQIQFILHNPIEYTRILLGVLKQYWSPAYVKNYLGAWGYFWTARFYFEYFMVTVIIIFLDKQKEDNQITTAKNRIWTWLLAFLASCIFSTIMYIAYTPVAYGTINGVQGRYSLPLLVFILYYLSDYRLVYRIRGHLSEKSLVVITTSASATYAAYCLYSLVLSRY